MTIVKDAARRKVVCLLAYTQMLRHPQTRNTESANKVFYDDQLETVYNATVTVVREADGQFRVADNL